jgi:hypothetical protein
LALNSLAAGVSVVWSRTLKKKKKERKDQSNFFGFSTAIYEKRKHQMIPK